ncbi:hypothetical protein Cgig2_011419 [Carnegiea gigantea]|uniref:Uncharacterized protein n=1 Tax=Carnegiea gigantea TaxID=171969 RepID=A0A9Q1QN28_9CARY|nr:hypothetical protein Cgig2_011419 [Carnegiea gigantea]
MIDNFRKEFQAPFRTLRTPTLGPPVPRSEVPASMGENELARLQSSMLIVAYHGFFQATWVAGIMLKQNLLEPPVSKASLRRPEQGINSSKSHKYVEILFGSFPRPSLLWLQNDPSWSQNISIITFNGCNLLFVEAIGRNVQGVKKNSVFVIVW